VLCFHIFDIDIFCSFQKNEDENEVMAKSFIKFLKRNEHKINAHRRTIFKEEYFFPEIIYSVLFLFFPQNFTPVYHGKGF